MWSKVYTGSGSGEDKAFASQQTATVTRHHRLYTVDSANTDYITQNTVPTEHYGNKIIG
jgi:hypothetical protein